MEQKSDVTTGKRFKCKGCGGFINESPELEYKDKKKTMPICPECGLTLSPMCSEDHPCTCALTIHAGITQCPKCGEPVCPGCGSSDISQVSRVTGYLADVAGFNSAKRQELKDRHRVDINNGVAT